MKAVRWHARDDVRLDEVPVPTPGATEVLIRIEAASICGTDVDEVRNGPITVPVTPHPVSGRVAPVTLGHEMVGVVTEAGPSSGVSVGARVAPWPSSPCGRCPDCLTGHANRCVLQVALGMAADGGMAEFLVAAGTACVPIGEDVSLDRAVLVEPFAVALHGVHQVDVAGARVAVVGIGSLGLCVVEAVARAGATEIVVLSRSATARVTALEAGAGTALPLDAAPGIDADLVFETAGAAPAVNASFAAVRRGGQIVVMGGHPRPTAVDLLDLVVREVVVRGSVSHCFADFVEAARAITAGELARTHRPFELLPLASGPAALRTDAATIKRILVPGAA